VVVSGERDAELHRHRYLPVAQARGDLVSYQAMCSRVWLDVPAESRIEGEVDAIRTDIRLTVRCDGDEFELSFDPAALRQFVELAQGLLAQADAAPDGQAAEPTGTRSP
jgi:hypothetical protein